MSTSLADRDSSQINKGMRYQSFCYTTVLMPSLTHSVPTILVNMGKSNIPDLTTLKSQVSSCGLIVIDAESATIHA